MTDRMQRIINDVLHSHGEDWNNVPFAELSYEIANQLRKDGYGLVGLGGPAQLLSFETPIQPTEDDCG